ARAPTPRARRPPVRAAARARARSRPSRARRPAPRPRRASKLVDGPRAGPDVAGTGADQTAGSLLLEDVSRPAGDACAAEHRRRQVGGDAGDVEHDGRPVLDVRLELAVGRLLAPHLKRRFLECGRNLDTRRAQLDRGALEHTRARVVRAVDTVAEAHDPLPAVDELTDVRLGL